MGFILYIFGFVAISFGLIIPAVEVWQDRDWPRATWFQCLCLIALGCLCLMF